MNKQNYFELELEISPFDVEDIVTASVDDDIPIDDDSDMGEWAH